MAVILFFYMMEIRAGNCLDMWQTQIRSQELKSNIHPSMHSPHEAEDTLEKHKLRRGVLASLL